MFVFEIKFFLLLVIPLTHSSIIKAKKYSIKRLGDLSLFSENPLIVRESSLYFDGTKLMCFDPKIRAAYLVLENFPIN